MDLKIFEVGKFTEKDYSDFCNTHLTYSQTVLANGTIYVFYREFTDLGNRVVDDIETLDKGIRQAQLEILTAQTDIEKKQRVIPSLKEKAAPLDTKTKEYKELADEISMNEKQILMHEDTIKEAEASITALKETVNKLTTARASGQRV